MPTIDMIPNSAIARTPERGGDNMGNTNTNGCNCGCQPTDRPEMPGYPPMPPHGCYPPYPPFPYPYDCCPPVNPGVGSIEAQIAKLSKKSACVRKQIDNLINKNKSIVISIGGIKYNYGTYLDAEGEVSAYAEKVVEILEAELEAIKAKITELAAELEVADESTSGVEDAVGG